MPDPTPIPTSGGQQSTAATGADIISQLIQSSNAANEKAALAMKAATIPIAGGHMQPQQVNTPGAGHIYTQYQLDNSPVVGHHQATMQGIANVSKGVANLVGQVTQAQDQKKTQALAVNIEQLMGAVNSADQAKQVLAQDPNNAAAQDQLKRAQAIQNEILGDDKNRKAISKAFNINFTDPSKNNTPEHAALKQASDSYAEQFTKRLPTTMAPNQQAIAQAQAAQAEAKATTEVVSKVAPAILAAESRENVARIAADQRAATADQTNKTRLAVAQLGYTGKIQAAQLQKSGHIGAALIAADARLKDTKLKIQLTQAKGLQNMKPAEINAYIKDLQDQANKMPTTISQLEQLRGQKDVPTDRKQIYDSAIQSGEDSLKVINDQIADARKELQKRGGFEGSSPNAGTQSNTTAASATGGPNYIADDDDDPDDF